MGTGIQDIISHCSNYGLAEPSFRMEDSFITTIYRRQGTAYKKVGGQIGGQITESLKQILLLIKQNQKISRKEISIKLNKNESAIQKQINRLKKMGIIERIGGTRGHWKISE